MHSGHDGWSFIEGFHYTGTGPTGNYIEWQYDGGLSISGSFYEKSILKVCQLERCPELHWDRVKCPEECPDLGVSWISTVSTPFSVE